MNLAESSTLTPSSTYTPVAIDVNLKWTSSIPTAPSSVPVRIVGISKGILMIRSAQSHVMDSQVQVVLSKRPLTGRVRGCAPDADGFLLVVEVPVPEQSAAA